MSYILMMSCAHILWGFGFENVGWLILVCGFSLLVSLWSLPGMSYILMSEWIGTDEMGLLMAILCILVVMVSAVSSCKDVKGEVGSEVGGFSIVEMVGTVGLSSLFFFQVCSWMDFYFFFEFSLIPTFYMILKWGYRPERLQAATFMVIYTVSSSLPLFMGLVWFWTCVGSDNMLLVKMVSSFYSADMKWPWLVMCLGFLIKLPVYGVHGWLPKAHVEAPLSGSMLLAGILLKFGGYGVIRFMWFADIIMSQVVYFILVISVWGGVLSSVACLCQSDLKSLIAYSSIGHMAMGLGALLTFYSVGKISCVCMLFAHGLCSPILFSLAASSYDVCGSRNVLLTKGILRVFPLFSGLWFMFCIINMGVPPSLNFFSEVFCVGGMMWMSFLLGLMGGCMCFIAGCYCLVVYSLVSHGNPSVMINSGVFLSARYIFCGIFLAFFLLFGGLCLDLFFV
uniref:NADH-ubiquinone oxidoreductase chain 4 n=1 Tax=Paratapes undulatus TaxID=2602928 RepID=H6BHV6_9BIVA|nr:NADH dehydrogenase subunit 4 [Paratapes undulatus]AEH99646.1 NADH dehydrogenase subunit 4 [Paratapes undulatus]